MRKRNKDSINYFRFLFRESFVFFASLFDSYPHHQTPDSPEYYLPNHLSFPSLNGEEKKINFYRENTKLISFTFHDKNSLNAQC